MTDKLEVGLRVPPCVDLRELQDFAARADQAGVGGLWFPDEQALSFVERHCLFGRPDDIRRGLEDRGHRFRIDKFLLHGLMSYELPNALLDVTTEKRQRQGGSLR